MSYQPGNLIRKAYSRIEQFSDNRIAFILFFVAFSLRFAYSVYAYFNGVIDSFVDDKLYYQFANEVLSQGVLFFDTSFHQMADAIGPGLPWINAFTLLVFGEGWGGIFLATSLFSGLITFFTYKVAVKTIDRTSALLAGFWSLFYLPYYRFAPTAGKDILMAFFMLIIIYFLIVLFTEKKFSYSKFLLFSFMYVYSFHVDERFLLLAPFLFFYILIYETEYLRKLCFCKTALFTFMVVILLIPWSIRNYIHYHKVVLLTARTEMFTDKVFGYEPRLQPWLHDLNKLQSKYYIPDYQFDSILAGEKTITDGGYKISEKQIKAMRKGNLPGLLSPIDIYWVRTKEFLRPFQFRGEYQITGYYYREKSVRHNLALFFSYGIMFFFTFPGFYFLYKRDKNIFYLFLSTIVIYTLIHSLFLPLINSRYRLPLDPIFIIVGCYGISSIYRFFQAKNLNRH